MGEARSGQVIGGKKGKEMRWSPQQSGPNQREKVGPKVRGGPGLHKQKPAE